MAQRSDWLLLVLDAAGPQGLTPVQLQKALFLLGKKLPANVIGENFYKFQPYNYGPFDRTVYSDAERIAAKNEVLIERRERESFNRYVISRDGEIAVSRFKSVEARSVAEYVQRLVGWVQEQTFESLVSAVYAEYPEMRINSVFNG